MNRPVARPAWALTPFTALVEPGAQTLLFPPRVSQERAGANRAIIPDRGALWDFREIFLLFLRNRAKPYGMNEPFVHPYTGAQASGWRGPADIWS